MSDKKSVDTTLIIKGTIKWANLTEPDEDGKCSVRIGELSEAAVEALTELRIPVKTDKKDGTPCISISHSKPIKFTIQGDVELDEDEYLKAGSTCVAEVFPFEWELKKKTGINAKLRALKIIKPIIGTKGGGSELESDEAL